MNCPKCGKNDWREYMVCINCGPPSSCTSGLPCSVPPRRNPVRVLNDALHEYRTQHTEMTKDEFYDRGCYHAFMWAWQRAAQNAQGHFRDRSEAEGT